MSERKVLNKYYPPDFDPSKIPRMKLPRNRQYTVRLMAPFNMRCATCGEYIYKGKKFNARKEDVEGDDYLGVRIYRFYIKCTRCLQEISFKTDPKNVDYEIEAGATRNFMALKLAEEQAKRELDEAKEEEANNPMKMLENRTEQSKRELELLESLEDLKDLNRRQRSVDFDTLLQKFNTKEAREKILKLQEQEDEEFVKAAFQDKKRCIEEVIESDDSSDDEGALVSNLQPPPPKPETFTAKPAASQNKKRCTEEVIASNTSSNEIAASTSNLPLPPPKPQTSAPKPAAQSIGVKSLNKKSLMGLVRPKKK
ncbi:unnamed protein product [Bemisia tabaci]|uniref:Splicing factor YJU2 n=1 Tax=Bemisia tabaci TaxID=7038 RepID=A0A9P0A124_BEMTA|nr:unnamed protein product [Bemisia tabaci]